VRNQILELVTQVGAQRRRDFAAQQTHWTSCISSIKWS
jgi:hypothetical protein